MKKLAIIILGCILLTSCGPYNPGEVRVPKSNVINANGKLYDVREVALSENDRIFILVPRDSATKLPTVITWDERHGKSTSTEEVIVL